jgi:hypothetical protein
MARKLFLFLLIAVAAPWAADDAWSKVKTLSTSTNVSVASKPDFEVVYRKALGAPKK